MKRSILATLVLSSFLVSTGWAQVGGSGTPNTIPQFITATTIGDSPIFQSGGSIGIGTSTPHGKLTVIDFRDVDVSGNGPSAIYGIVSCKLNNLCAAERVEAATTSLGAHGLAVVNQADNEARGGG